MVSLTPNSIIQVAFMQRSHMSEETDMQIFLKKDYMQYTGSFKERGARYTLIMLPEEQRRAGVVSASAGNHAQAMAYHGGQLSKCTVQQNSRSLFSLMP